jgi:hypothetical protein
MPLISLLGLVHLGVTLAAAVLGQARCGDDGRVDDSANVQHQASGFEHGVDDLEELLGQVMFLQQETEPQDADPIGNRALASNPAKSRYSGVSNKASSIAKSLRPTPSVHDQKLDEF